MAPIKEIAISDAWMFSVKFYTEDIGLVCGPDSFECFLKGFR